MNDDERVGQAEKVSERPEREDIGVEEDNLGEGRKPEDMELCENRGEVRSACGW